ncbi:SpaH/EbpB family LPXTG-anchored major pilin [Gordonibacter sp.]|uniref:SpaH/EbpB family LPXTG-anchored major pilin n=1 Tax=Gordonibacter sp. TaxID=1968902 RepID=UPI002FCB2C51
MNAAQAANTMKGVFMRTIVQKSYRKAFAILLAVFVALAMVPGTAQAASYTPVQPDTTGAITITGISAGDTVKAYRIVETTYNKTANTLTSAFPAGSNFGITFADYSKLASDSAGMKAAADKIAAVATGVGGLTPATVTATSAEATFTNLAMGQYLIAVSPQASSGVVFQNTIVSLVPAANVDNTYTLTDATIEIKSSKVTIDKKADGKDQVDEYAIGDVIPFTITATVPSYPENATNTKFVIGDTLSGGLTFKKDVTVKIGTGNEALPANAFTLVQNDDGFTYTLKDYSLIKQYAGQNITLTYSATVNEAANVTNPETNTAKIEFANNPYDSNSSDIITDKVVVTTYGVYLLKVDGSNQTKLSGAEFTLYKEDAGGIAVAGITPPVRAVKVMATGADGIAQCDDLGIGTYYLKETKAPAGYLLSDTVTTVTFTANTVESTGALAKYYNAGTITNAKTPLLPQTGGEGTLTLTLSGLILITTATGLAVWSHRKRKGL